MIYVQPLLLLALALVVAHVVPRLVESAPVGQETLEDLESESAAVGWTPAVESSRLAEDLAQRVNDERVARGLQPLVWHEELAALARQWSEEMLTTGYRHSPDSFRVVSGLLGVGENILLGYVDTGGAHVGWMESDPHRQNILTPGYTRMGVGVVCRNDGRIWATQLFGLPMDAEITPGPGPIPPLEPVVRREPGLKCGQ